MSSISAEFHENFSCILDKNFQGVTHNKAQVRNEHNFMYLTVYFYLFEIHTRMR